MQAVSERDAVVLHAGLLNGWHLLSLDAPSVAVLWTWFVARSVGVVLPWVDLAAMFLAVWVLYAADRLLDARAGRGADGLEARHHFHHRHRTPFRWGIGLSTVALACLLPGLLGSEIELYLVLGGLLVSWFLLIHSGPRPLPKEFVVGIFFAAAVFVPTVAREPMLRTELSWPAALFGALCSLNCLFIFAWEHPELPSRSIARPSPASFRGTSLAAPRVAWLALGLALLALGTARWATPGVRQLLEAVTCGAGLLGCLHFARARVEKTTLRALADMALVLPLVAFWLR